jgi:hypothetical protein
MRFDTMTLAVVAAVFVCGNSSPVLSQSAENEHTLTVRGRVLNGVTNEPISRALVNLQGQNAATFTDDRGQFELRIQEKAGTAGGGVTMRLGGRFVEVRKLGFIQDDRRPTTIPNTPADQPEGLLIQLLPEAKIVGHIDVPSSEGDVRITSQLFRKEMNDGRENWVPQGTFVCWVDGEFRFFELRPGTYKLITHEQMDQESMRPPGAQLYGYPPVYYANTTDFSLATPIVVKAGETARVNLTVTRKGYFSVRIGVENMPTGAGALSVSVSPMGHHSPGWSLGYNPREGMIQGILPDGDYTVEASTLGEGELTGILNFSVEGKPLEGPTLMLLPDATIAVRVHEEFQSSQSNFGAPETVGENAQTIPRRYANVNVNLTPVDDLSEYSRGASSRVSEASQGTELTIPDVRPGRYRIDVNSAAGYVASIQSGGKDLAEQPLVVGMGGEVPPIEIVLRDNGAHVEGTLDEETSPGTYTNNSAVANPRFVYLLPIAGAGRLRSVPVWRGTFRIDQVPPGNYLVVAFDQQRKDLPSGPGDAMQRLIAKGQMIHLEPDQTATARVKVIGSEVQ